jgi:hypothetical protein
MGRSSAVGTFRVDVYARSDICCPVSIIVPCHHLATISAQL